MTVLRLNYQLRRLATLAVLALTLGVAVHGLCQAIEHHDGLQDAALCAVAVVLVAAVGLGGGNRRRTASRALRWATVPASVPGDVAPVSARLTSAAWLQRFQN